MLALFLLLHFTSLFIFCKAQQNPPIASDLIHPRHASSSFQPSLAIVVGMLSIIFSLTFILLLYVKFCQRSSPHNTSHEIEDGLLRSRLQPTFGLDKTVVESLPFFTFSSLKGSREGLECSVCLSKFNDIEVLRLLPKCRHAFHIDCIDRWLGEHSTCPLCRRSITLDDVSFLPCSDSLRLLWLNQVDLREESNVELFVEREGSHHGSSRFCVGSSFRKSTTESNDDQGKKGPHKVNHKILVSDVVSKSRWSSISPSDLVFLNSEMLNQFSNSRFSSLTNEDKPSEASKRMRQNDQMMNIIEEIERKRAFEAKIREINTSNQHASFPFPRPSDDPNLGLDVNHNDKRSMSEIITYPRFTESTSRESTMVQSNAKEERMRRLWLPIARKTIHWFETRENRPP